MKIDKLQKLLHEFGNNVRFEYDLKKKKLVQYWWQIKSLF